MILLLVVLLILMVAGFPAWPYSQGWGYYPSGGVFLVLVLVLFFLVMRGRL